MGDSSAHGLDHRLLRFRNLPVAADAVELAADLLAAGRTTEALEVTGLGLSLDPDGHRLLLLEGKAWLFDGDLLRAQAVLLKAARLGQDDPEPLRWLAQVLIKRGDPKRAEKVLERAQVLDPDNPILDMLMTEANDLAEGPADPTLHLPGSEEVTLLREGAPAPYHDGLTGAVPTRTGVAPTPTGALPSAPGVAPALRADDTTPFGTETVSTDIDSELEEEATAVEAFPPMDPREAIPSVPGPPTDFAEAPLPPAAADPSAGDTDEVLRMLERQGVFELPDEEADRWLDRRALSIPGSRTRVYMLGAWGVGLLLVVSGFFAFQQWTLHQKQEALRLVSQADALILRGVEEDLEAAEAQLREAWTLDARQPAVSDTWLKLGLQRALERGVADVGELRRLLARAEVAKARPELASLTRAVLAAEDGEPAAALRYLRRPLRDAGDDAFVRYVAGRLEQRLGQASAAEHLSVAVQGEGAPAAVSLAFAELRAHEGRVEVARRQIAGVLERAPEHLRAAVLKAFIEADEVEPAEGLRLADELMDRVLDASPTDQVMLELTRARLLRRKGDVDSSRQAIERAAQIGVTDPRMLALMASEARSSGSLRIAAITAGEAIRLAPDHDELRKLWAEVLVRKHEADRALTVLAPLSSSDVDVLTLNAEVALALDERPALEAALNGLEDRIAGLEDGGEELEALRIRVRVHLGSSSEAYEEAHALATDAPSNAAVVLAFAEAALAVNQVGVARGALERLTQAQPQHAEASYMLGVAAIGGADAEAAEAAFRRALAVSPFHYRARVDLAELLQMLGRHDDALSELGHLDQQTGVVRGLSVQTRAQLAIATSLSALGRHDQARAAVARVQVEEAASLPVRVARARVLTAANRAEDALAQFADEAGLAESPVALAVLAAALRATGDSAAARGRYEQALRRDPGLLMAHIGRTGLALDQRKKRDAEDHLAETKRALRRQIHSPSDEAWVLVLEARLSLLGSRGRSEAQRILRRVIEMPAAPAAAHYFLGEAFHGDNDEEARAAYERYLAADPSGYFAERATQRKGGT